MSVICFSDGNSNTWSISWQFYSSVLTQLEPVHRRQVNHPKVYMSSEILSKKENPIATSPISLYTHSIPREEEITLSPPISSCLRKVEAVHVIRLSVNREELKDIPRSCPLYQPPVFSDILPTFIFTLFYSNISTTCKSL